MKVESDDDDIRFSIDIERGSKSFHIRVGNGEVRATLNKKAPQNFEGPF